MKTIWNNLEYFLVLAVIAGIVRLIFLYGNAN